MCLAICHAADVAQSLGVLHFLIGASKQAYLVLFE